MARFVLDTNTVSHILRRSVEYQIVNVAPPALPEGAGSLGNAILEALAKTPSERPASATEFARLLGTDAPAPAAPPIVTPSRTRAPEKPATPEPRDPAEMIVIPAGEFWMGSAEDDAEARDNEKPRHQVFVDTFEIDKDPVTSARWKRFMDAGGYREQSYWSTEGWKWRSERKVTQPDSWEAANFRRPDQPVVGVSWYEAEAFCRWAGKRLPTEAEWEKAARGTDARKYPWGNEWDSTRVNRNESKIGKTTPVGQYPNGASPYGVRDMTGNGWEWAADWFDASYYRQSPKRNPEGPDSGQYRVLRGGAWNFNPIFLRAAFRDNYAPATRNSYIGVRCAWGPAVEF